MRKTNEHQEQVALFEWAFYMTGNRPELALLLSVPNGGHRHIRVAVKLKREGVKAGVPDVFLPVAKEDKHGLWIEMKVGYNKPSDKQLWWLDKLSEQGYECVVCYSFEEAKAAIEEYLGMV